MYFQMVLSRLGTLDTDDVLAKVYKMMKESGQASRSTFRKISHRLKEMKFDADELFQMLRAFIFQKTKQEKSSNNNIPLIYRYHTERENGKLWSGIIELTSRLIFELKRFVYGFGEAS